MKNSGLSRAERKGIAVMLLLLLMYAAVPYIGRMVTTHRFRKAVFYNNYNFPADNLAPTTIERSDTLHSFESNKVDREVIHSDNSIEQQSKPNTPLRRRKPIECRPFDPNTVTKAELYEMQVPANVVKNLIAYRQAGAEYRDTKSIEKIYGMHDTILDALLPCISFPKSIHNPMHSSGENAIPKLDLNSATAEELESLPGIGNVLGNRIVKYRKLLGGFYSIQQIKETYGLKDEHYVLASPHLELRTPATCLNINTDDIRTISSHPYIDYKLAKGIIEFIRHHGKIKSLDDLYVLKSLPEDQKERLRPYLCVAADTSTILN